MNAETTAKVPVIPAVREQLEAQGFAFEGEGTCTECAARCLIVRREGIKFFMHPEPACVGYDVEKKEKKTL